MTTTPPNPTPLRQDPLPPTPEALVAGLLRLLDVEEIDTDLYRGARHPGGRGRVFGGQVIAQALTAAIRSVSPGLAAHSLHAYFMRAGDEGLPIVYRVERDFEGRSFSTRRVIALQRGLPILNMAASFQRPEEGLAHQSEMPEAPPPESLESEQERFRQAAQKGELPERLRASLISPRPIEMRPVEPPAWTQAARRAPHKMAWFKAVAPIGDDPDVHRAVLAFASDMALLSTSLLPHGVSWVNQDVTTASLDHALWLHEPFRADEWLLYVTDSPWAGHGRSLNRGHIFSRDGRMVASVSQEALIRLRRERPPG